MSIALSGDIETIEQELNALKQRIDAQWNELTSMIESSESGGYTDAEAIAAVLANDGPGSGLNADLLDDYHLADIQSDTNSRINTHAALANAHHARYTDTEADARIAVHAAIENAHHVRYSDAEAIAAILANDGPDSQLDADLLDGQEGAYYLNHSNLINLDQDDHPQYTEHAAPETITARWMFNTGPEFLGGVQSNISPNLPDTYDLGEEFKPWRRGWFSELSAVLFGEYTQAVVGGSLVVPHDQGTLAEDVNGTQTQIDFGKAMTPNDFVVFRGQDESGLPKIEYMKVSSLSSGTTYNVTRDVDGSGANAWAKGTVFAVYGASGDGRIEISAQSGGPRVSILEQGATYNAQTERLRLGDLSGISTLSGYGVCFGNPAADSSYAYYSPSTGWSIKGTVRADAGYLGSLDVSGLLDIVSGGGIRVGSGVKDSGLNGWFFDNAEIVGQNAGVDQVVLNSNGEIVAASGNIVLNKDKLSVKGDARFFFENGSNKAAMWLTSYNELQFATTGSSPYFKFGQFGTLNPGDPNFYSSFATISSSGVSSSKFSAIHSMLYPGRSIAIDAKGEINLTYNDTLVGQISVKDTSWLRLNEGVSRNVYTPRMFRAYGGLAAGSTNASTGQVVATSTIKSSWGFLCPMTPKSTSKYALDSSWDNGYDLSNEQTVAVFGDTGFSGMFIVQENNWGAIAIFMQGGGIVKLVSESVSRFSTSAGTGSRINVYVSSGRVYIQNRTGSKNHVRVMAFRTRNFA